MLCKKHLISFGLLLSGLFSVLLSCSCYAIDDLSISVSTSDSVPITLFPNCDQSCYSSFSYLVVDISSGINIGSPSIFTLQFRDSIDHYLHAASFNGVISSSIYSLSDGYYDFSYRGSYNASIFDITFTLTNSLPGNECPEPDVPTGSLSIDQNGTYDVTDYSEAVVNVPQVSDTPYNEKLDEIKMAILLVPAVLLLIYFFYCIYRMLIKGGS